MVAGMACSLSLDHCITKQETKIYKPIIRIKCLLFIGGFWPNGLQSPIGISQRSFLWLSYLAWWPRASLTFFMDFFRKTGSLCRTPAHRTPAQRKRKYL